MKTTKIGDSVWIINRYNEYINSGIITNVFADGEFLFTSDDDGLCYSSMSFKSCFISY